MLLATYTYYLVLTTYYVLLTTNYWLLATNYLLLTTNYLLLLKYYLLLLATTDYYLLLLTTTYYYLLLHNTALHYLRYITLIIRHYAATTVSGRYITTTTTLLHSHCTTPLQPLQPFQKTQLQPPVGPSVDSLCHPWFTTTNLSYRFLIYETSATALRGTTGKGYASKTMLHHILSIYPGRWNLILDLLYSAISSRAKDWTRDVNPTSVQWFRNRKDLPVQGVEPFDCISQNLVSPLHYQSFRYGCKAKQEPVSFMTIQPEGKNLEGSRLERSWSQRCTPWIDRPCLVGRLIEASLSECIRGYGEIWMAQGIWGTSMPQFPQFSFFPFWSL